MPAEPARHMQLRRDCWNEPCHILCMLDGLTEQEWTALPEKVRRSIKAAQLRANTLEEKVSRLEYLVSQLKTALYGKKTERFTPEEQSHLFEDLEVAIAETKAAEPPRPAPAAPSSPKRNIGHLPEDLPRIERTLEPESTACPCGCGEMAKIGEDRTERLDIIPAQFRVIVTIRPRYACKICAQGVTQVPSPPHLIEGGMPTEALIAHVLMSKYGDHSPLYRQAGIFARSGIELDRSTLANWVGKAAFHLSPLVDRMMVHLKTSSVLSMDETPLPVLDPGRGRTKTGYLWALARDQRGWGGNDPPGIVYTYAPSRAGENAARILKGWTGTLLVDGYAGYNQLASRSREGGAVCLAHCWAHARRKLFDIFKKDGSSIAQDGLRRISPLYDLEREIRGRSADERLACRQQKAKPILEDFHVWLHTQRERVSRKSRLGLALTYIAQHWQGLTVFAEDGHIEIDNNLIENRIRPQALTRKNALFAGHDEGGASWAKIASLIETCRLNDIDPYAWLHITLTKIAQGHPESRMDDLLPWNDQSTP